MTQSTPIADTFRQMPVADLLRVWCDAEPARFPLNFGGLNWGAGNVGDFNKTPYDVDIHELVRYHFSAALDSAARHLLALRIERPAPVLPQPPATHDAPSLEVPTIETTVHATDIGGQAHVFSHASEIEATVRCVVAALANRPRTHSGPTTITPVISFAGEPVTEDGVPRATNPVDDMRTWARLEPSRFEHADTERPDLQIRGKGSALLAPAHRAMVALQYFTVTAVFDAAAERGWWFELGVDHGRGFTCRLTDRNHEVYQGQYPTPGPACVKAYLHGLGRMN